MSKKGLILLSANQFLDPRFVELKAIDLFSELRQRDSGTSVLKSISAVSGSQNSYGVVVQTNDGDVEFVFAVKEQYLPTLVSA